MHVVYYCHYMPCIIIYYFVDIYTHCNLLEMLWTYNTQVFHMLHAITLRYLNIFVKVKLGELLPPPPLLRNS